MFNKKAKKPTKAEAARMARLKEGMCVACTIAGHIHCGSVEVHHLLSGNKRRGHLFTIPLCSWHHRGESNLLGWKFLTNAAGPSLALGSKAFHIAFGTDDELLERTNKLLERT